MNEELVFNPTRLDISRSVFPIKRRDMGTGFVGRLNTLRPFEVLPGSTFDIDLSTLIRFTTPLVPTMDDLFMDVYFYYTSDEMLLRRQSFSPNLNDGNHSFAAIMGAQDGNINMPLPDNDLQIPVINYIFYSSGSTPVVDDERRFILSMSLLDQLGYPLISHGVQGGNKVFYACKDFNCLPLLGYISIWNEDFREPNLQNRFTMTIDDGIALFSSDVSFMSICSDFYDIYGDSYGESSSPLAYDENGDYALSSGYAGESGLVYAVPFGVSRFHGLFGSLLPWPQRNSEAVTLPLGDVAPVITLADQHHKAWDYPLHFRNKAGDENGVDGLLGLKQGQNGKLMKGNILDGGQSAEIGWAASGDVLMEYHPDNLWADLKDASAASINTIRVAFQTQKWFEALARGGNSDLDEYINSLFGVVGNIDVESKRPVYLGGKRIPISISQVNNTGSDTGETGAFSLTNDSDHYFKWHSKSYGMIYCVFCIRHADMFADAPQKFLLRRSKFDFYFPQFANLGEEQYPDYLMAYDPTLKNEDPNADSIIGYQEYAADYRYDFNSFSGMFRFQGDNAWHYGTLLEAGQFDLAQWLDASYQALDVDRTLKVPGGTALMQFYYDFFITGKKYLPMPVNSIPGLVDHH